MKIYCADDEVCILRSRRASCMLEGHEFRGFSDLDSLMSQLKEDSENHSLPDLLVCDKHLGPEEKTGCEFFYESSKNFSWMVQIPKIIMTGEDIKRCDHLKYRSYIDSCFSKAEDFTAIIEEYSKMSGGQTSRAS